MEIVAVARLVAAVVCVLVVWASPSVLLGLWVLIMGWLAWLTGWGAAWVNLLGSVYIGYQANWWGPIVGAVWAFVDAFITGAIIAFVYNSCMACCKKSCDKGGCDKNRMSSM